jgi:GPH family glycoside/pentoside/hexuronide:cation symporter
MIFLTDRVGLPADQAGYAVAIGVLWDAFADPILGRISDKTSTAIGKRLPWMIAGSPLLALAFVHLYLVESVQSTSLSYAFWQVTLINIILNTAMTMVSIPHLALGQDLAKTRDERTSLYAWRTLMTLLGLLVGILTPVIFVALGYNSITNQPEIVNIVAGISILSATITIVSTWKEQINAKRQSVTAVSDQHVQHVVANPIKILMAAFFVATLGQGLNSTWALYYYRYRLQLSEQALGTVLIVFIVSLCGTLPVWVKLAKSRRKAILISLGTLALGIVTAIFYPLLPPGELLGPLVMAIIGGIFLGSTGLLESLLVDVAEISGVSENDMGLVFGYWKFVAKGARAAAIAIGGYLLNAIGYAPTSTDLAPQVVEKIALLFGPVVGVFFVMAAVIILYVKEHKDLATKATQPLA